MKIDDAFRASILRFLQHLPLLWTIICINKLNANVENIPGKEKQLYISSNHISGFFFWKEKNCHQKSCFSRFFENSQDISLLTSQNFFFSSIKVKAFSLFISRTLSTNYCWSLPVLPIFRTKMKQLAQPTGNFPYILGKVALIVCNFVLEPKIRRDS